MKRNYFKFIALSLLLVSCDGSSLLSSINESTSSIESSSQTSSLSEESSSSIIEKSIDLTKYTLDDELYTPKTIEIFVGEKYNVGVICEKTVGESFEIVSSDYKIAYGDEENNVVGLALGEATITVAVSTFYDQITFKVISKDELNPKMKLDKGRLYNKHICIFGDSISDNTVTAYPKDKPTFWCDMLVNDFSVKSHNYAKSGATCGYTSGQCDSDKAAIQIAATNVVHTSIAKKNVARSDYAFIYIGNNDIGYGCDIGEYGDVNADNRKTKESFLGSYTYLIDKLREYNPNIAIICMGLHYSTWTVGKYKSDNYYKTRPEMCTGIKNLAEYEHAKYVNLFDLWGSSDWQTYIPDGMHPTTAGYELIYNRLLNS